MRRSEYHAAFFVCFEACRVKCILSTSDAFWLWRARVTKIETVRRNDLTISYLPNWAENQATAMLYESVLYLLCCLRLPTWIYFRISRLPIPAMLHIFQVLILYRISYFLHTDFVCVVIIIVVIRTKRNLCFSPTKTNHLLYQWITNGIFFCPFGIQIRNIADFPYEMLTRFSISNTDWQ